MFEDMKLWPQKGPAATFERRDILKMGAGALLAGAVPFISCRKAYAELNGGSWGVRLRNAHTGETFSGAYRVGDSYLPEIFQNLNHFLRDFRTGEVFPMDPHVLDIISLVQAQTGTGQPLQVISAYRCPKTNAMLQEKTRGVAKNSFHMYGQAVDITLPGYSIKRLRDVAMGLQAGGVGYYPKSGFVHVDTGKARHW